MSGYPYPEGVRHLRAALGRLSYARKRAKELRADIESREREEQSQIREVRESLAEIDNLMSQMDVKSTGNHGYESRRLELLLMMYEQGKI